MHRSRMLFWFVVEAQWPLSSYSTDLGYDDGSHWQEAGHHGQGSLRGLLVVQQALSLRVAITEGGLKDRANLVHRLPERIGVSVATNGARNEGLLTSEGFAGHMC